jgi:hypothetical protein
MVGTSERWKMEVEESFGAFVISVVGTSDEAAVKSGTVESVGTSVIVGNVVARAVVPAAVVFCVVPVCAFVCVVCCCVAVSVFCCCVGVSVFWVFCACTAAAARRSMRGGAIAGNECRGSSPMVRMVSNGRMLVCVCVDTRLRRVATFGMLWEGRAHSSPGSRCASLTRVLVQSSALAQRGRSRLVDLSTGRFGRLPAMQNMTLRRLQLAGPPVGAGRGMTADCKELYKWQDGHRISGLL